MGSTPAWVVNLNAPLKVRVSESEEDARKAKRVARRVSERGGGLRGVQAMALDKRVEVGGGGGGPSTPSPPLLFTGDYAPAENDGVVVAKVVVAAEAADEEGANPDDDATTTATTGIIEVACNLLSPDAGGGIEAVAREIARLAKEEGLEPAGAAYRIGASVEELAERWLRAQAEAAAV